MPIVPNRTCRRSDKSVRSLWSSGTLSISHRTFVPAKARPRPEVVLPVRFQGILAYDCVRHDSGPRVVPHYRVVVRPPRPVVPGDGGLPLIRDSHGLHDRGGIGRQVQSQHPQTGRARAIRRTTQMDRRRCTGCSPDKSGQTPSGPWRVSV